MAKMFYTLDEAKAVLGRSEEEVKMLVEQNKLRQYRDGAKLMFKADQVDSLKGELGAGPVVSSGGAGSSSGSKISLASSDTGLPLSLSDSKVTPTPGAGSGSNISLADTDVAGAMPKDDTALAADLGLSGSVGGVPSPGQSRSGSMSGTGLGRSASGINVFNPDEVDAADPGAQTAINPALGDQVEVGSGSGLLDLTREGDDTSLGAELLDEIGNKKGALAETQPGTAPVVEPIKSTGGRVAPAVYVEAADPTAPGFAGAALGAAVVVMFGIFVLISGMMNATPEFVRNLARQYQGASFTWIMLGAGLIVSVIFFVGGLVLGKAMK